MLHPLNSASSTAGGVQAPSTNSSGRISGGRGEASVMVSSSTELLGPSAIGGGQMSSAPCISEPRSSGCGGFVRTMRRLFSRPSRTSCEAAVTVTSKAKDVHPAATGQVRPFNYKKLQAMRCKGQECVVGKGSAGKVHTAAMMSRREEVNNQGFLAVNKNLSIVAQTYSN